MNKYYLSFKNKKNIDIQNINLEETTPTDRYWILACLARYYYKKKSKDDVYSIITYLKRLEIMHVVCAKIKSLGEGYLEDKYKDYLLEDTGDLASNKQFYYLSEYERWCMTNNKKIWINLIFFFIFSIISGFLGILLGIYKMLPPLLSVIIPIALIWLYVMTILRIGLKKSNTYNNVREDVEYEDILDPIFKKDDIIEEALQDEFINDVINAKSEFEMSEIIRKYPKK